eukprot:g3236.t1
MGPNPNYTEEDHPEGYARYHGKVSASVLMALAACVPEMRSVSLRGSKTLSRVMLRALSCGPSGDSLTALDLSDSSLDNDSIQVLAHFEELRVIDLAGCTIADSAMQWVVEGSYASLRQLNLARCTKITDVTCEWLAGMCGFKPKPCRQLMSLDLGHCARIGDRSLSAIAHGCSRLAYLNLELCIRVTDHGIEALTAGCQDLRVLILRRLSAISNYSLACIGKRCHKLRSICLDFCINVGDSGVEKLARGCPHIECVSFAGCYRLSERTVCAIAASCPKLMALNVTGCQGVTENGLANLCRGNGFLEPAESFQGLKPRRDCERMKVREMEKRIIEVAAAKIQNGLYRAWKGRVRFPTATRLQGILRGWLVRKREILNLSRQIKAATIIQARYRCYATPPIAVFATRMARKRIDYNAAVEAKDREVDAARTREDYRASQLKDSASEDEEAEEWTQFWNEEKDVPFWYSEVQDPPERGGCVRRQTTFHDPYGRDFELGMVGNRCKVRWPRGLDERVRYDEWGNRLKHRYPLKEGDVEQWFEGIIISYHVDKDKHRVYFTGSMAKNRPPDIVYSREWICMRDYPHRIQIEMEADDGSGEKAFVLYHTLSAEVRNARKAMIERMRWERAGGEAGPGGVSDSGSQPIAGEHGEDNGYAAEGDDQEEWESFVDEETGASYWYSHVTGESVWDAEE